VCDRLIVHVREKKSACERGRATADFLVCLCLRVLVCVCVRVCVCARGVCVECEREIVIERQIVIELSVLQVSGSTTCMGLSFRK